MKCSTECVVVILLFFIFIFYATYGGVQYVPYESAKSLSIYPYENFVDFPDIIRNASENNEVSVSQSTIGVRNVFQTDGLTAGIYGVDNSIDSVSKLEGSHECIGNSFGYSNSKGGLCLTDDVRNQLTSRGGNFQ